MNTSSDRNWQTMLLGKPGVIFAFVWGLAEATLFFIVPDLIITLAAMLSPKKSIKHIAAAIVGAVIAGTAMFYWAEQEPEMACKAVLKVPYVTQEMSEEVVAKYQECGAASMLTGPLDGIPYKLYAVHAPQHTSYPSFITMSIPARFERFIISWALFALLGIYLRKKKIAISLSLSIYAIYWLIVYAYYWNLI